MEDPARMYRTLYFLVNHGDIVAAITGVVTALLSSAVCFVNGFIWAIPVSILAGAFLYLILRSYVELVRVIVDMLLPK